MLNKFDYIDIIKRSYYHAKDLEYKSFDVSDHSKTPLDKLSRLLPYEIMKYIPKVYKKFSNKYPHISRKLNKISPQKYPQAQAMLVRGLIRLANKGNNFFEESEIYNEVDWILQNKSNHSNGYLWGQPYDWYSSHCVFPSCIPRTTVTSQVGLCLIELFEWSQNEYYLDIAKNICFTIIKDFNFFYDEDDFICISYTTLDNYLIHNASMLAASLFIKVYQYSFIEEFYNVSFNCGKFTKKHQGSDGSFEYKVSKNRKSKIDNYHTGFVLESFYYLNTVLNDSSFNYTFKKGLNYYVENLFEGPIPKMTNNAKYPIDIQSCAQSIITLSLDINLKSNINLAHRIAKYTIKNLFLNDSNHFAYQLNKNKIDKSFYFRWSDSWMIRALAYLV